MTDYKETVFLPRTDFSMRAGLPTKEPQILKLWEDTKLFDKLREQRKSAKPFIFMMALHMLMEICILDML